MVGCLRISGVKPKTLLKDVLFLLAFFIVVYVTTWLIISSEFEGLRAASIAIHTTVMGLILSILGVTSFILGTILYISNWAKPTYARILAIALIGSGILICTVVFLTAIIS